MGTGPVAATTVASLTAGPVEYRYERHGAATVLLFHGGHMRAGLALGEDVFTDSGYSVLVPSRPGYGRTPLGTDASPEGFADASAELCSRLAIDRLAAVVGVSGGGPTAIAMAARHPERVERVILLSAVGSRPWPALATRVGALLLFNPRIERATWGGFRLLLRVAPEFGLRLFLASLSTEPITRAWAEFDEGETQELLALCSRMRSGLGFRNDLRPVRDLTGDVSQPTLVIATRTDRQVPFAHAEALAASIPNARLVVSEAAGHLLWFGPSYSAIASEITDFLSAGPATAAPA